jgi:hypothetical protein
MWKKRAAVLVFVMAGCSVLCPEPFGREHVLLFVTPTGTPTDGSHTEITIPQHYATGDQTHSCTTWDFDFDNTQIEAMAQGSLTVVTAERIPSSDPSWKAGGYRLVVDCHLPAGADEASDAISVRVHRSGETVYADSWVQRCRR